MYPQSIEWIAETSQNVIRPACCVAFSLKKAGNDDEVVVVAELRHSLSPSDQKVAEQAVRSVCCDEKYSSNEVLIIFRNCRQ